MAEYLKWKEQIISDFSSSNIEKLYNNGYLFGRQEKGSMYQTRSVRVDLAKFELSSENRRILRKTEGIELTVVPLPYSDYHWSIGKLAKDFYDTKFGEGTFTANKVKEIFTDAEKSNFNVLLVYTLNGENIGYSVCYQSDKILHYSYPFYDLEKAPKDMGLGMMTRAIEYAKSQGMEYIYLGSAQRPTDTYKFQFAGIEWFDLNTWRQGYQAMKTLLTQ